MNTYQGNADAFIVKMRGDGVRLWGRYLGGSDLDRVYRGVAVDGNGDVYVAGVTGSTSGIATPGTHQTTLAGYIDGFIMKLSPSGNILWGTYFGGSGRDEIWGIAIAGSDALYVTGYTESSSGIATSDGYQTSLSGGVDAFLARFRRSNGTRVWGSYYGAGGADVGYHLATVESGGRIHIWMAGGTESSTGMASHGAHQTSFGGGGSDAFLAKFCDPDCAPLFYEVSPGGSPPASEGKIRCYAEKGRIVLTNSTERSEMVEIIDGMGRCVWKGIIGKESVMVEVSAGVYAVRFWESVAVQKLWVE